MRFLGVPWVRFWGDVVGEVFWGVPWVKFLEGALGAV